MMENLKKTLGTLLATTDGKGLYTKVVKTFPMAITFEIDPKSIERDDTGKIIYAYGHLEGAINPDHWDTIDNGYIYCDDLVEKNVNAFLASLGYKSVVGWSEFGRQELTVADFDYDYTLVDEVFGEELKK